MDKYYDGFIRTALASGFTDDQADFMWEFIGFEIELLWKVKSGETTESAHHNNP